MIRKRIKYIKGFILFALFSLLAFSPLCFIGAHAQVSPLTGLVEYNAFDGWYQSAIIFKSSDGGNTYQNIMSQDVSVSITSNKNLRINKSNPWDGTSIYYVDISFSKSINYSWFGFYASHHPLSGSYLLLNDNTISNWQFGSIDGTSYMYIKNIYQASSSIRLYFTLNGYVTGSDKYFDIIIKGFDTGVDAYNDGYEYGYGIGYVDGNADGYTPGYNDGYSDGISYAHDHVDTTSASYQAGVNNNGSYATGYAAGYAKGRTDQSTITDTNTQASDLLWTIGSTPWESFKNIWNVNLLGVNLANLVTGFITAIILIWIIKKFWK